MSNLSFMDMFRSFLGLDIGPPRNDFRNPLWGTDDDDYDNELYDSRRNTVQHYDPADFHREMTEMSRHMEDLFKTFGGMSNMFGNMNTFVPDGGANTLTDRDEDIDDIEGNIRDYYLNPDYSSRNEVKEDKDLDGKVSSNEIANFLKRHDPDSKAITVGPFPDNLGPAKSFFQTVITTRTTKPDGTVETRRVVRDQNGVVEETTTENMPMTKNSNNINMDLLPAHQVFSDLSPGLASFWKMFY